MSNNTNSNLQSSNLDTSSFEKNFTNLQIDSILKDLNNTIWEKRFLAIKKLISECSKYHIEQLPENIKEKIQEKLVALLDDSIPHVRSQAALAIGKLGFRNAAERLVNALADPNEWVRVQVAEAIGLLAPQELASIVARHLEAEDDVHVKATLVKALGLIGDPKQLPVLILHLDDKDPRVRANTVEAISMLKLPKNEHLKTLQHLTKDPNNRVRANIAISFVELGIPEGREILEEMLKSNDEYMRASAVYALGCIKNLDDLPILLEKLSDSSWLVRKNAVKSIIKFGPTKALVRVTSALLSPNAYTRYGALEIIGAWKEISARQAVIALLEDENGEVRSKAEEVLDLLDGF